MDQGLEELEKVLNVSEEITGGRSTEFKEELENLVSPYRKFHSTEVLDVKQAPFSSATKTAARAYFFHDLIILAVPSGSGSPNSIGSMLETEEAGKRKTLKRYKGKYQILAWLDLRRCTLRMSDETAIQITFVTRRHEQKKTGTMRVVTKVEKIELWFSKKQIAEQVYSNVTCWIEDLIEVDLRRPSLGSFSEAGSVTSASSIGQSSFGGTQGGAGTDTEEEGGDGLTRTRSWASRKNTLKRNGTLKSRSGTLKGRSNSGVSVGDSESVGGLSLSDLESRYKIKLDSPPTPDGSVEFVVEYGEGMMGFSLSSGAGIGVIVGRVAPQSFSDDAGVCIGDRIVEVADQEISLDTNWQTVVEMIKKHKRPIRIKFERFAGRSVIEDKPSSPKGKGKSSGPSASNEKKLRGWAAKRAQRAHATEVQSDDRLISLTEVEKLYKRGNDTDRADHYQKILAMFENIRQTDKMDENQLACKILEEIWRTERAYVQDLRTLVREFILPLRRKVKRGRCKDIEGSRICEHNMIRSQCSKQSLSAESIVSAADMRTIFINVETLVKINTELLNFLEKELLTMASNHSASVIKVAALYGPAFEKVLPFFKLYSLYCHQYPIAIDRLLVIRSGSPELHQILLDREKKAKVSLNSLLIKPVQRICKYPLLFRELLRHTKNLKGEGIEKHIQEIEKSAAGVQEIASAVNDIVGQNENQESLIDIYNELGGEAQVPWLIEPHRKFITRCNVLMHEAPYDKEATFHIMYVCSDIIIIGKGSSSSFTPGKTGGKSGSSRMVSLKRAFGSSLKKKNWRGSLNRSSTGRSMSSHRSGNKSGTRTLGKNDIRVVKVMELKSVTPRLLTQTDDQDCHGIEIKYVERKLENATKKGGTGKINTNIEKLQIWVPTKAEQSGLYQDLLENVKRLKDGIKTTKEAKKTLGTPKAQRTWRNKSRMATLDRNKNN